MSRFSILSWGAMSFQLSEAELTGLSRNQSMVCFWERGRGRNKVHEGAKDTCSVVPPKGPADALVILLNPPNPGVFLTSFSYMRRQIPEVRNPTAIHLARSLQRVLDVQATSIFRIPMEGLTCCSVTQLCPTLQPPWTAARQASLSFTISWSLLKLMFIESVMPSIHLILCRPLLLLSSIFPSIRDFSNELALCIRWSKD